jgi:hypothetical protein
MGTAYIIALASIAASAGLVYFHRRKLLAVIAAERAVVEQRIAAAVTDERNSWSAFKADARRQIARLEGKVKEWEDREAARIEALRAAGRKGAIAGHAAKAAKKG